MKWFKKLFSPLSDKEKQDFVDGMDEFLYGEKMSKCGTKEHGTWEDEGMPCPSCAAIEDRLIWTNGLEEGDEVIIRWDFHPTDGLVGKVIAIEKIAGQAEAMLALEPPFNYNDRTYAYHSVNVRYLEKLK